MDKSLIFKLSDIYNEKHDEGTENVDWEVLVGQIVLNRVIGIAYNNIHKLEMKIPNEVEQCLRATYEFNKKKAEKHKQHVKYICEVLAKASFKYALLKGAYLSAFVYNAGERTSNDIDILIDASDLSECQNILEKNGFVQGKIEKGKIILATRRDIILSRMNYGETVPFIKMIDDEVVEVDLNFSLDFKPNGSSKILRKMLDNAICINMGEVDFMTLAMSDFMIHLCAHLYKEATTYDWVRRRKDLNLYKFSDINVLLHRELNERFKEELIARIHKFDMKKECYYAFYNAALIYTNLHKIKYFDEMLEKIQPESLEYMKQIVYPAQKSILSYECDFVDWFHCADRVAELEKV